MPAKSIKSLVQNQAYRIAGWQLVCLLTLSTLALLIAGLKPGLSIFAGSMAYWIAQLFFIWRAFRYTSAHQMTQFVAAFMSGEVLKLLLSGILFIIIVKYLPVSLLSVLTGFICAIISFWLVCLCQFSTGAVSK